MLAPGFCRPNGNSSLWFPMDDSIGCNIQFLQGELIDPLAAIPDMEHDLFVEEMKNIFLSPCVNRIVF